jgi:P2-related tail formation protein
MGDAIASAVSGKAHITAFGDVAQERFAEIPLDALLVYLVDTVDASALPWLAQQFDALGLKGYGLATTEAERRQVVARAIELARYRGTPFGIKYALELIGFPNSVVIERPGFLYNAEFTHDGSRVYGAGNWATFAIWVNSGLETISPEQVDLIRRMVDVYKNVRSVLVQIIYIARVFDLTATVIPGIYCTGFDGGAPIVTALTASDLEYFGEATTYDVSIAGNLYNISIEDITVFR